MDALIEALAHMLGPGVEPVELAPVIALAILAVFGWRAEQRRHADSKAARASIAELKLSVDKLTESTISERLLVEILARTRTGGAK